MTNDPASLDRFHAIETLLMHVQHDLEQLHEAVLGQRRELDDLRADVQRVRGDVERLEIGSETRDPKLEKPPHF